MRRKNMKKTAESLEAVYIYIYISQVLIKQIYVNIAEKLCVLDVSKMHSFLMPYLKYQNHKKWI